ncbi:alcohol dehydrogenase catalytic domain-containing protein [Modestobacter sp. CPCC 205119]|uniref:Alcohol dehydrogenase catalytic domain-containing protein n=1 Tax=Goekera deserti TaxID=2497753 RepID=A0A7K3WA46_9ACTN|nr:alcohol dehydrogenase catalytic domain-containing protein [Goekera deserti]
MRALVFEEFGGPLVVRQVPDPSPATDGVVVRVEATGVCRSDWHAWSGHDPDVVLPHVPGHELAGTVAAVGAGVRRWSVGVRVTVPFVCACGSCPPCRDGDGQVCLRQTQPGFTHWGSFAELVALDAADVNLVALPDGLPARTAAALGCRFATAFRAVTGVGRVRPGEWVAVHGCGGVGLSAVQVAVAVGARVVAVDVSPGALALARAMGAEHTLDVGGQADDGPSRGSGRPDDGPFRGSGRVEGGPSRGSGRPDDGPFRGSGRPDDGPFRGSGRVGDVVAAVRELTGGGVHVSLDCLGSPATCLDSIRSLRPRGRHVQVGLLPPSLGRPAVPMELVVAGELAVLGSHGMAAGDYPAMLSLIEAGRLDPAALVTRELDLDGAGAALAEVGRAPGVAVITSFGRPAP